jgi:two-component system, sporulation sensor kinase A
MDSSVLFMEKRKVLEDYLREHYKSYKTLFNSNPDAIFTLDLHGYFVSINPACEEITGYSRDEITKLSYQHLIQAEFYDKVNHLFHKALKGEIRNYDCQLKHRSGRYIDVNLTNVPISVNDEIIGVYCIARDITEIKRKSEEHRKLSQMYNVLIDNSLDIVVLTDFDGKILYVSQTCSNIVGYTQEELVGAYTTDLIHQDDLCKARSHNKTAASGKEVGLDTYRLHKKDGGFVWIEALSKPIFNKETKKVKEIVSIVRDITQRKLTEEEIIIQEERYRNLVEHSPDAVVIIKDAEIIYINDTGMELFGASNKDELIGREIFDLLHPDYISKFQNRIKQLNAGQTVPFMEKRFLRVDGEAFDAEVKGMPTIHDNVQASHLIIRDIAEKKQTQELLLRSEKLSVAGQLAAGIAHEVRNPLTAIKGFLQLMEEKSNENKPYFDIIGSEINRIELILSELLALAKPQEMKVKKVNLEGLIGQVKTLLDTQAIMNNIEILTEYRGQLTEIICDENQIKQVFINLFKNSIEAMSKGGTITVQVSDYVTGKIKITFKDTGAGIPPHILKRIGEPFFTTKENGTGLGLMISKQIIENHNGEFHLHSDSSGTTIEMIFPV